VPEVRAGFPELVDTFHDDGFKTIDYGNMTGA